jgi:hypothetical protein
MPEVSRFYGIVMPARALGLVTEWAALHQRELLEAWNRASRLEPPGRIDPLP